MMSENACAGDWSISTDRKDEEKLLLNRHEDEARRGTSQGKGSGERSRRSWNGVGADGCRHVRWKGTDV